MENSTGLEVDLETLVGKRCLVRQKYYADTYLEEVTILEFSPNKKAVKVKYVNVSWWSVEDFEHKYELFEILEDSLEVDSQLPPRRCMGCGGDGKTAQAEPQTCPRCDGTEHVLTNEPCTCRGANAVQFDTLE